MAKVNPNYQKLPGSYLFSEIARRTAAYSEAHPEAKLIKMGIGDVTRPLVPAVIEAMHAAVEDMAKSETFHGYGPEQGYDFLRAAIVKRDFHALGVDIADDEIFISDGAKSDCGNIGDILDVDNVVAVCDPVYPVYVDSNAMAGRAGDYDEAAERWTNIVYMPTTAENGFCPALPEGRADVIYLCSPNNPTGTPLPMADIERILAACETADVAGAGEGVHPILVIDEAYVEFRKPGTPSAVSLIKNHPNLAVSRTMSKAFAFAGARVGYLAASKGIIDCVRIVRMPYHLSAVTQAAALAAFEHTDEQLSRVEHLREIRESTAEWLSRQTYKGEPLEVAESGSNFLLFGGHFDDREAIFDELLRRGVLIRVVGPDGWLRMCMGTDKEMEQFRNALTEALRIVESR